MIFKPASSRVLKLESCFLGEQVQRCRQPMTYSLYGVISIGSRVPEQGVGKMTFESRHAGQSLAPTSQLYVESLQTGGLPYRKGNGFYTPQGSIYVVDYYGQ